MTIRATQLFEWLTAVGIWLSANGFQVSHIIGDFCGGIARAMISKTGTRTERLFGGFTGSLFAVYLTPLIAWFFGVPDPAMVNAIAFAIGLLGMHIGEALLNLAKLYSRNPGKLKDDLREIVLRLIDKRD